ncbi:hypothetical protein D3C75_557890 [compost metagenome]
MSGRVDVDVGPDHLALRVVAGVGQIVEVVVGDDHVVRVLLRGEEPRIDPVVAVPGVEVERGNQLVGGLQAFHQRVELGQTQDAVEVLLLRRGAVGIEGGGASVICLGVEHAIRSARVALALELVDQVVLAQQDAADLLAV